MKFPVLQGGEVYGNHRLGGLQGHSARGSGSQGGKSLGHWMLRMTIFWKYPLVMSNIAFENGP